MKDLFAKLMLSKYFSVICNYLYQTIKIFCPLTMNQ